MMIVPGKPSGIEIKPKTIPAKSRMRVNTRGIAIVIINRRGMNNMRTKHQVRLTVAVGALSLSLLTGCKSQNGLFSQKFVNDSDPSQVVELHVVAKQPNSIIPHLTEQIGLTILGAKEVGQIYLGYPARRLDRRLRLDGQVEGSRRHPSAGHDPFPAR